MKLSKLTRAALKNFASINNSVYLRPGKTILTKSINGVIYAEVEILDEIDSEMGVYDVPEFLSTLNLFKDDTCNIAVNTEDLQAQMFNDKFKAEYTIVDPSVIRFPSRAANFPVADVKFTITSDVLSTIKTAATTFGSPDLLITTDGNRVVLKVFDAKEDTANAFSAYADLPEENKNDSFEFYLKVDNLKMEDHDYVFSASSKGAVLFETILDATELAAEADKRKYLAYKYIVSIEKGSFFTKG